jgi:hypothetical protein
MQHESLSSGSSTERVDEDFTSTEKKSPTDIEAWPITREVRKLKDQSEADDGKLRKLGVTWKNLTIKGVNNDAVFNENVLSQLNPLGKSNKNAPTKTIIDNSSGCVKPGGMWCRCANTRPTDADNRIEMLLVLGNPGAGCTSLLNILSNRRLGYAKIDGDVSFGSMSSDEAKDYRGQIVMVRTSCYFTL